MNDEDKRKATYWKHPVKWNLEGEEEGAQIGNMGDKGKLQLIYHMRFYY